MPGRQELPVRAKLRNAALQLRSPFTPRELKSQVLLHHPGTVATTVEAHITKCTVNNPSRVHFPQNQKPRTADRPELDFLYRLPGQALVMYDPEVHGSWEIRARPTGHLEVGLAAAEHKGVAPTAKALPRVAEPFSQQPVRYIGAHDAAWRQGAHFLKPDRLADVLALYARVAARRGWPISDKMSHYAQAGIAFAVTRQSAEHFDSVYAALRAKWRVFRGVRQHWSAQQVFAALCSESCRACSRGRLDLVSVTATELELIWNCLAALRQIKTLRRGRISAMAVSKFLHFYNPSLFPIFDNAVVELEALPAFAQSLQDSRERWRRSVEPLKSNDWFELGLGKYLDYLLWAHDCFSGLPVIDCMRTFLRAVTTAVDAEGTGVPIPKDMHDYYATAFEFALIGASCK